MDDRAAEDQRVVHAVLEGDRQAFGELVVRYQRMIAGVAWRHGARQEELEDLTSEVFIKVYRRLDQYRPEHPFSTWLFRLAANHDLDHRRRARRARPRAEMPREIEDPAPDPGQGLESRERSALVREALNSVAPRYRAALLLVYVEGLKVDEAARTLGLPVGTIKSRLMRGREALRKILARHSPELFLERRALP